LLGISVGKQNEILRIQQVWNPRYQELLISVAMQHRKLDDKIALEIMRVMRLDDESSLSWLASGFGSVPRGIWFSAVSVARNPIKCPFAQ